MTLNGLNRYIAACRKMKIEPFPRYDICKDPEHCDKEHNPWREDHHYGCECNDCMDWYRSLK